MRDLEADLRLCEAAHAGPWRACVRYLARENETVIAICCNQDVLAGPDPRDSLETAAEARFIAAARTGWPETIRELQAARQEIEALLNAKKSAFEECARLAEVEAHHVTSWLDDDSTWETDLDGFDRRDCCDAVLAKFRNLGAKFRQLAGSVTGSAT